MIPVLSTRAFGRLPTLKDLALARRLGFLDFELWMAPLEPLDPAAFDEWRSMIPGSGIRLSSVHLPASNRERALDRAIELGVRLAIVHSATRGPDFERLMEQANERAIRLAFENDTGAATSAPELVQGLARAGSLSSRHGLCLDLSRLRPPLTREVIARALCAEASTARTGRAHAPPDPDDLPLRELLRTVDVDAVTYEVVPLGPAAAFTHSAWSSGGRTG
jgi:hypothetical protein